MLSCGTNTNLLNKLDSCLHNNSRYLTVYMKKRDHQDYFMLAVCCTSGSLFAGSPDRNCHFSCCFLRSGECRRAQTVVIIHNSPFLFHWYLPADIELRNVADVTKCVQLKKYSNFKGARSTCGNELPDTVTCGFGEFILT